MDQGKKILFFIFFFCCLIHYESFCQDFHKGSIFNNKGDTANGFLYLPPGYMPAGTCAFRPTMNDNIVILGPNDIGGFQVSNQTYVSTRVRLTTKDSVLFARLIFRGSHELQYFEIVGLKHFIIKRPDSSLYVIKYPPDLKPDEVLSGMTADLKFRQQTDSIFPDVPDLPEYQNGVRPDIASILNLFRQYHNQPSSKMTKRVTAQVSPDYIKGYVITRDNDTLTGLLGHNLKKTIFSTCIFSPGRKENAVRFTPSDIAGFGSVRMNKIFVSAIFPAGKKDTSAFVRLILDGTIDLLYYESYGVNHFLIRDNRNRILNVSYPPVLSKNDYLSGLNSMKKFRIQTDSILSVLNIPKPEKAIKPQVKSMIRFLELYHQSLAEPYRIFDGNQKIFEIGPVAGVRFERYLFEVSNDGYKSFSDPAPYAGLYLGWVNRRNGMGIMLRNTVGYHNDHYSYNKLLSDYELFRQTSIKSFSNNFDAGITVSPVKKFGLKTVIDAGGIVRYYFTTDYENYSEMVYPGSVVMSLHDHTVINSTFFYGGFVRIGVSKAIQKTGSLSLAGGYNYLMGSGAEKIHSIDLSATYNF